MTKEQLKKQILEQIEAGKTVMKPRWHFVVKTIAVVLGMFLLACFMLFLTSFVLFVVQQTGVGFAPSLGLGGAFIFFRSLPWLVIVLALLLFIVLEYLVKRHSFVYRKPISILILVLVLVTVFGSALIAKTTMHQRIANFTEQQGVFGAGRLYEMAAKQPRDVHKGVVSEVLNDTTFMLQKPRATIALRVSVTKQTKLRDKNELVVGAHVVVIGKNVDGEVIAKGIRLAPPEPSQERPRFLK